MVEHHIENDTDAGAMQGFDGRADFGEAARRQARIGRHETHRIVSPGIDKAQGRQMPLVDPGRKRHELDRVDAEPVQMGDDRRLRQRRDGAAQGGRHFGMELGERLDRNFVDAGRA